MKRKQSNQSDYWASIEAADREVNTWPAWKKNLGNFKNNYCLELQNGKVDTVEKVCIKK